MKNRAVSAVSNCENGDPAADALTAECQMAKFRLRRRRPQLAAKCDFRSDFGRYAGWREQHASRFRYQLILEPGGRADAEQTTMNRDSGLM